MEMQPIEHYVEKVEQIYFVRNSGQGGDLLGICPDFPTIIGFPIRNRKTLFLHIWLILFLVGKGL